ncbi:TPA: hypothetical protein MA051_003821 [Klebsiella pneumoniae]|mgnify:FL=1|uniref:hypothetical protein n=1 Tax=Klebsiella pneumoniae complex TaxID=3390273 RepID=UPI000D74FE1C|nr:MULTISPECIES: hypothetical protein [Klebsiella]HBZ7526316.1 hypothetical protein [Klebsiella quasipneumoniae subsp. similipneumoniae]EIV7640870.1 hypothetical protein [Klebsiella pneumoniae]EIX9251680.1 hypothetical protein [Klebsiella pneumoniae]EJC6291018.1 hypothetical protein [Klebsiella pneumoniae]MBL0829832.1 hypothetical protein [Klebsiella pneumoniae]
MVDPTSLAAISGTLDLVNKSVDLVRNLRKKGDEELTSAEMRNTLIDLLDDLVEVKSEFVSLKAVLLSKEEEIQRLKAQLAGKTKLKFDGKIYWLEGDETPYCSKCYEKNSLAFHLSFAKAYPALGEREHWYCMNCNATFHDS